jgi:hypothetical protein
LHVYTHSTIQPRHLQRCLASSPRIGCDAPRDATGDMLLAQTRGEHGEAAQPAFLPFPRHARVWHASRWLGIKKGLHIIRRPANLPGRFVPKSQPRWICCARMYLPRDIVHSSTSETRCTLAVQLSEYIDQLSGCYCTSQAIQRENGRDGIWGVRLGGKATTKPISRLMTTAIIPPCASPQPQLQGPFFIFPS